MISNKSTAPANRSIQDPFWSHYIRLVREVMVPYQWEALNDRVEGAAPSHAVRNFKIAAGEEEGSFYGMVFQDSDAAKWLESAAYLLETHRDPALEETADSLIELIVKSQREDGYINTYFTLKEPGREWTNLAECHELYCAGHLIEAGTAYYRATGKPRLLEAVCRFADYMDSIFGREAGKLRGYDGHQEIELALYKLYQTTGKEKYLQLCRYFLEERGRKPHYFEQEWENRGRTVHFPQLSIAHDHPYSQSHLPVKEQTSAEGHAVRLVYMCSAMADVAAATGDEEMRDACRRLWDSIVNKRMYVTGGIGSMEQGESFSADYDLPGDLAYAETCASVGLIFFARRMLGLHRDSRYADVMERALYNTVIGGLSLDGTRFFYVNPLEVYPEVLGKNKNYNHVKAQRQGWFSCACCPPNAARLLASLGEYIYTASASEQTVYVELYIGGQAEVPLGGQVVAIDQQSDHAADGRVRLEVSVAAPLRFTLALRFPSWSDRAVVKRGDRIREYAHGDEDGYIRLEGDWEGTTAVEISFSMPVRRMQSHPLARHTFGRTALQRGPFVYCLEEADNGKRLYQLRLPRDARFTTGEHAALPAGVKLLRAKAVRLKPERGWRGEELYQYDVPMAEVEAELTFIPYFAWANRGEGEMTVWVAESHPM
ncbi:MULTISPECIES: glycoside hydrolase family 127 protein [Paenibacillus]|uniref:glycoside hydrolase family 127 protein n=1 Tax=Paenibacillus TaxID=44249 RepID=UPI0022B8F9C9|nr:beta-L-arabinofuranosidase domain-containing protein [Paenibacillus caseinilyticus]MCZ8519435.1 glycoside hydrolase family 127 protein [Paenibacillus caseinilyticus]